MLREGVGERGGEGERGGGRVGEVGEEVDERSRGHGEARKSVG